MTKVVLHQIQTYLNMLPKLLAVWYLILFFGVTYSRQWHLIKFKVNTVDLMWSLQEEFLAACNQSWGRRELRAVQNKLERIGVQKVPELLRKTLSVWTKFEFSDRNWKCRKIECVGTLHQVASTTFLLRLWTCWGFEWHACCSWSTVFFFGYAYSFSGSPEGRRLMRWNVFHAFWWRYMRFVPQIASTIVFCFYLSMNGIRIFKNWIPSNVWQPPCLVSLHYLGVC